MGSVSLAFAILDIMSPMLIVNFMLFYVSYLIRDSEENEE